MANLLKRGERVNQLQIPGNTGSAPQNSSRITGDLHPAPFGMNMAFYILVSKRLTYA